MSVVGTTKRLGEMLIGKGLLNAGQLERALQEQRSTGEFLGAILVRKGMVTEEALLKTLGEQVGIPYVRLSEQAVDWTLAGRFPSGLLTEHACFPLRIESQWLIAAVADPLDAWAVSELEKEASARGRKVQLVLCSAEEIRAAVAKAKHQTINNLGTRPQ